MAAINKDFRNTDACPQLVDVVLKKNNLENKIRRERKRVRIIYNSIRDKQREYFKEFAQIYNNKCAYCGASLGIIDIRLFEIDHFICEAEFTNDTVGRIEAGKAENLVFSCYLCNRGKGSLHIDEEHRIMLNPDDCSITDVFFRDADYYIRIKGGFNNDEQVRLFYDSLTLGCESRRIDYLLLEIKNLIHKQKNTELANRLEQCMGLLLLKKNNTLLYL